MTKLMGYRKGSKLTIQQLLIFPRVSHASPVVIEVPACVAGFGFEPVETGEKRCSGI